MSHFQRFNLIAASLTLGVLSVLVWQFWDGFAWSDISAKHMMITVLLLTIVYSAALAAAATTLWSKTSRARNPLDEREQAIEANAEKIGYRALDLMITLLVFAIVLETLYAPDFFGPLSLLNPVGLVFTLTTMVAISYLTRFTLAFYLARVA
ncbi:hypothetical protein [Cohaesibacter intestini]|uniref:hypothetical protein n=1 Tax=Cohaesibacter intestini TaxID=2211145 RepID=UPI000DEB37E3|nr:hypothetical protein [Cohaesibacter intestini]